MGSSSRRHPKPSKFCLTHVNLANLNYSRVSLYESWERVSQVRELMKAVRDGGLQKDYERYVIHPHDVPPGGYTHLKDVELTRLVVVYDYKSDAVLDILMLEGWTGTVELYQNLKSMFKDMPVTLTYGTVVRQSAIYRCAKAYADELTKAQDRRFREAIVEILPKPIKVPLLLANNPTRDELNAILR